MLKKQSCDLKDIQLRSGPFCSAVLTQQVLLNVPGNCAMQQCLAIEDNGNTQLLSAVLADRH